MLDKKKHELGQLSKKYYRVDQTPHDYRQQLDSSQSDRPNSSDYYCAVNLTR
jgi:hypothetical protein